MNKIPVSCVTLTLFEVWELSENVLIGRDCVQWGLTLRNQQLQHCCLYIVTELHKPPHSITAECKGK